MTHFPIKDIMSIHEERVKSLLFFTFKKVYISAFIRARTSKMDLFKEYSHKVCIFYCSYTTMVPLLISAIKFLIFSKMRKTQTYLICSSRCIY